MLIDQRDQSSSQPSDETIILILVYRGGSLPRELVRTRKSCIHGGSTIFSAMVTYGYAQVDEGPGPYKHLAIVRIMIPLAYEAHGRINKKRLGEGKGSQADSRNNGRQEREEVTSKACEE